MSGAGADVAVVGAAGRTGRRVVAALRERGAVVREVVRRASGAASGERVEADLEDVAALAAAFRGCRGVHLVPPLMHPAEDRLVGNAVIAAATVRVQRFVLHSVLRPNTPQLPHHLRKARSEAALQHSTLDWTVLQPGTYAQNFSARLTIAGGAGVLPTPYSVTAPLSPTDMGDIAEVSARMHSEGSHGYATYELVGPEVMTHLDMASRLSELHHLPVSAELVPIERALARALTLSQVADFCAMYAHYDDCGFVGNPRVLGMLLGRRPTAFVEAIARDLAAERRPA